MCNETDGREKERAGGKEWEEGNGRDCGGAVIPDSGLLLSRKMTMRTIFERHIFLVVLGQSGENASDCMWIFSALPIGSQLAYLLSLVSEVSDGKKEEENRSGGWRTKTLST